MEPMNGPGSTLCRAINMRGESRHYQKLIGDDIVPAACDFTPAFAFRAIDKNRFWSPLFARTDVTFGLGIIPSISWQKTFEQRVPRGSLQNRARDHYDPLPFETFTFLTHFHRRQLEGVLRKQKNRHLL